MAYRSDPGPSSAGFVTTHTSGIGGGMGVMMPFDPSADMGCKRDAAAALGATLGET
jgi:hypothetical protein